MCLQNTEMCAGDLMKMLTDTTKNIQQGKKDIMKEQINVKYQ